MVRALLVVWLLWVGQLEENIPAPPPAPWVEVSRGEVHRKMTVTATAYTWTGNRTATGTWPKEGRTIAVDPKVIPLGSTVVINGKRYIAEDTGGDIKGHRIDIYMASKTDCIQWGRRSVDIEIE